MKNREINDWMTMNNIIYKIYTTEDEKAMRRAFLEQIQMLIDFDCADFYLSTLSDPPSLTEPVTIGYDHPVAAKYDAIDYSRSLLYDGKCMVYRETDIISDESRRNTPYYQLVYLPNRWHYAMQMILAREKRFLGVVTLYRTIGKDNFLYDDIFILDMLKDHMAYRLWQERERDRRSGDVLSVHACAEKYGLTRREETVLGFLADGVGNDQICRELVISLNTLRKHIMNIYKKIGVKNRLQLIRQVDTKSGNIYANNMKIEE